MENKTIKWGILGPGGIASQFARDLAFASNAELTAVGSRSLEKATEFAGKYGGKKAYGSYEELVNDAEIDIIYVSTPHPTHRANVLQCLRAGKAVLCEKPFTVNVKEAEEIVQYARENRIFLMEAMWTRFLPVIRKVREWIEEGRIGELRLLKADFGFRTGFNPEGRLFNPELAGGALLDVGIYPLSLASMLFGGQPKQVLSTAHLGETGIDEENSMLLTYEGGQTAMLTSAIRLNSGSDAYIVGTKGSIRIPSFFNAKSATITQEDGTEETFADNRSTLGFVYEAEAAGQYLREGKLESDIIPLDESLQLMRTMDEIRRQWGLRYPFE
ncbi:Gfo/Idh/MocA family protein [Paenibacillus glycanilyticus]|uniref:Dehydrogenase n=1 Tax=Paenibacillus glycanilyticus TaxID=126569 RepID=A0ABQ6GET0_9BACL|nr:Gfo/Idh/MocA family oxidoreductase [Paenibacillus glycanilyticus]GLX69404.1 dehydrogenase [Paenibacillus glycanilyticus]